LACNWEDWDLTVKKFNLTPVKYYPQPFEEMEPIIKEWLCENDMFGDCVEIDEKTNGMTRTPMTFRKHNMASTKRKNKQI